MTKSTTLAWWTKKSHLNFYRFNVLCHWLFTITKEGRLSHHKNFEEFSFFSVCALSLSFHFLGLNKYDCNSLASYYGFVRLFLLMFVLFMFAYFVYLFVCIIKLERNRLFPPRGYSTYTKKITKPRKIINLSTKTVVIFYWRKFEIVSLTSSLSDLSCQINMTCGISLSLLFLYWVET